VALGTPYIVLATANAGGVLSAAYPVTAATATGDALAVALAINSGTVTGVTDSKGNTYTLPSGASNTAQSARAYCFVANTTTALTTSDTITASYSTTGGTGNSIIVMGVSGAVSPASAAADIAINAASTSTAPAIGPSAALANASEYAVALISNGSGGGVPSGWSGGFTAQSSQAGGSGPHLTLADQVTASTAALSAGATIVSTNWCMVLLTLRAAASAALPDLVMAPRIAP
jgi:hypothetical protein